MDADGRPEKDEIVIDVGERHLTFLTDKGCAAGGAPRYVTVKFLTRKKEGMKHPFGYLCALAYAQQINAPGNRSTHWKGIDIVFATALFKEMGTTSQADGFLGNWHSFGKGEVEPGHRGRTILLTDPPLPPEQQKDLAGELFGHEDKHWFWEDATEKRRRGFTRGSPSYLNRTNWRH